MNKEKIKKWIDESNSVIFFIGAGMSVASGIPTFRGKHGLWTFSLNLAFFFLIFTIPLIIIYLVTGHLLCTMILVIILNSILPFIGHIGLIIVGTPLGWKYLHFLTWIIFKFFFFDKIKISKPNDGHKFISFIQTKKNTIVVTQNVDNLEIKGGFKHNHSNFKQLHGNVEDFYCLSCKKKKTQPFTGKLPLICPKCEFCGKRKLRTGCLLFNDNENEMLFPSPIELMFLKNQIKANDLCFIVGTEGVVNNSPKFWVCRKIEINILSTPQFEENLRFMYIKGKQSVIFNEIKKIYET